MQPIEVSRTQTAVLTLLLHLVTKRLSPQSPCNAQRVAFKWRARIAGYVVKWRAGACACTPARLPTKLGVKRRVKPTRRFFWIIAGPI